MPPAMQMPPRAEREREVAGDAARKPKNRSTAWRQFGSLPRRARADVCRAQRLCRTSTELAARCVQVDEARPERPARLRHGQSDDAVWRRRDPSVVGAAERDVAAFADDRRATLVGSQAAECVSERSVVVEDEKPVQKEAAPHVADRKRPEAVDHRDDVTVDRPAVRSRPTGALPAVAMEIAGCRQRPVRPRRRGGRHRSP